MLTFVTECYEDAGSGRVIMFISSIRANPFEIGDSLQTEQEGH